MKILRNIAYAIIGVCVLGCILILFYSGKNTDEEKTETVAISNEDDAVFIDDGEISIEDVYEAAQVIISDVKDEVIDKVNSISESISDAAASIENKNEISYEELVRLQEEEALALQKALVEESNKKNGIVTPTASTSTSSSASTKVYSYVVNLTNKKIHKIGCTLEPLGENAKKYEKLSEAIADGYKDKCPVCSP